MAPVQYTPEKGITLVAKKGLNISIKANAVMNAGLSINQVNIGENGTSMGSVVVGGSLITILGAAFKAAYNLATFSATLTTGYSVSNYASMDEVKYTNLVASYGEIADDNGVVAENIRTAARVQNNYVKKSDLEGAGIQIEARKNEINNMCTEMTGQLTQIQSNRQLSANLYHKLCAKRDELTTVKNVIANLLNEVKTNSSSAVASKKEVAQIDSEPGNHINE